jgi:aspartate racemase
MKTLGLIGGMSWESTLLYYRLINEGVRSRLGGLHSAQLILYSVDFEPIERMQAEGRWEEAGSALARAAQSLHRGGAQVLVLCTNTMHCVAEAIEAAAPIPLLHIADSTAEAIARCGLKKVALLGTRFTMEQPFYRARLERFGLTILTPAEPDRAELHRVIYDELCLGRILDESRAALRQMASRLVAAGAEGVILGCTEIGMLLGQSDLSVPAFDTTALHAAAAVEAALADT